VVVALFFLVTLGMAVAVPPRSRPMPCSGMATCSWRSTASSVGVDSIMAPAINIVIIEFYPITVDPDPNPPPPPPAMKGGLDMAA
jgi:hypothetical protein